MAGTLFMGPAPQRMLIVGLGGGSIPTALREILPQAQIDVVEIDPAVTRVARRFFDFSDDPKMKVIEVDGRVYVKRAHARGHASTTWSCSTPSTMNTFPSTC